MGFAVEGPESPLETDDPAALRAQLVTALPQREVVEQRIKPTVIRRRMKHQPAEEQAQMTVEPAPTEFAQQELPAREKPAIPEKEITRAKAAAKKTVKKKPEAARIIEMAPKPAAKTEKASAGRKPEVIHKPVPGGDAVHKTRGGPGGR